MRKPPPLAALLVAATTALAAAPALASWPFGVTTNLPVCTAPGAQNSVAEVADGAGGVILAWTDHRTAGPSYDIYVQRVSWAGAPTWTAGGVLLRANAGAFSYPVLTSDGAGGAIVAWMDARNGSDDIYAQRVDATGTPTWTAGGVPVVVGAGDQVNPRIVADGAAGAFVGWQDADLHAQHLSASGTALWGAGVPLCAAAGSQSVPAIAADGQGGLVAAWGDFRGSDEDVYAQRLNAAGSPVWTVDGIPVCQALNDQRDVTLVPDGFGGALVAWEDERNGLNFPDLYAQHVSSSGSRLWTSPSVDGVPLVTLNGSQSVPQAVSDGVGGMIVVWQTDHNAGFTGVDIYCQRVSGAGVLLWAPASVGAVLTSSAGDQTAPVIAADEAGGAIVAWQDHRGSTYDVYARRITAAGAQQWALGGVPVTTVAGDQSAPVIVDDGYGGAVVAWTDSRADGGDIYAERIEPSGLLGDPAAAITAVADQPADQGGHVLLQWTPSDRDTAGSPVVNAYRIWRSVPPQGATTPTRGARRARTADPDDAVASGALLVSAATGAGYAWEWVGTEFPQGAAPRVSDEPTASDATSGANPYTAFMVETLGGLNQHWYSLPDSGYSLDNLAPPMPNPFVGAYAVGATHLAWPRNTAPDFAVFRLYRGTAADFVPAPANQISSQPDTGYVDVTSTTYYYKLTAVDLHGNASAAALVGPSGAVDVAHGGTARLELAAPAPNPARLAATLRYSLAADGPVRLALFDASGRRVRTLVDGVQSAGEHVRRLGFDGDDGPPLASGVYLVRLETADRVLTRRLAVVR